MPAAGENFWGYGRLSARFFDFPYIFSWPGMKYDRTKPAKQNQYRLATLARGAHGFSLSLCSGKKVAVSTKSR
jgi:hypothetical protein